MTDVISLCTPTRRRPDRFSHMAMTAFNSAADPKHIEIVGCLDEGEEPYPSIEGVRYVSVPRPLNNGQTRMSGLWSRAWEHAKGDIAMLCGDDVEFTTLGWDERVREAFRSVPDRIVMVYAHSGNDVRPILPFVSREWIEAAGFTPDHLQGWFADEWIWAMAAEIGRVIFLDNVVIRHNQFGMDITYSEGMDARSTLGGLDEMRKNFYHVREVEKRDALIKNLQGKMKSTETFVPAGPPQWLGDSLRWDSDARGHARQVRENTLSVVHCYAGDKDLVKRHMPLYKHHNGNVLVLSPEDAPVNIKDVECRSAGGRGYFGQVSLDRQRQHLEILLQYGYEYFLLNDADSMCLEPVLPRYLYNPDNVHTLWSNQVLEWRPHWSPYPKIALQPPYFVHRSSIERMLSVAHWPQVQAHPVTPYIDWYMLALACESGVPFQTFPDGASFPAWGWTEIGETQELGHDVKHKHDPSGKIRGDLLMHDAVSRGRIFIHSVKHEGVLKDLIATHEDYVERGSPPMNTMTLEDYFHEKAEVTERVDMAYFSGEETTREPL